MIIYNNEKSIFLILDISLFSYACLGFFVCVVLLLSVAPRDTAALAVLFLDALLVHALDPPVPLALDGCSNTVGTALVV